MSRVRVSTTVDEELIQGVRDVRSRIPDAVLIDEALQALLSRIMQPKWTRATPPTTAHTW